MGKDFEASSSRRFPLCREHGAQAFSAIDPSGSISVTPITMVSQILAGTQLKTEPGGGGSVPFLTWDHLEFCSSGNKLKAENWSLLARVP